MTRSHGDQSSKHHYGQGIGFPKHATAANIDGVQAEYVLDERMVVFSHGFGVQRDSRGMYTDLSNNLPAGTGYVMFDYYEITGDQVRITEFTEQVTKLKAVLTWVYRQRGVKQVHVVGHSMGSIVVALAMPVGVDKAILLAPPLHIGSNTRNYFMNRAGVQKGKNTILVPRRDGTTSIIPYRLFDEFETVQAKTAILEFAAVHPAHIIAAQHEEILIDTDYSEIDGQPGVMLSSLPGTHNFTGEARQGLTITVNKLLVGR